MVAHNWFSAQAMLSRTLPQDPACDAVLRRMVNQTYRIENQAKRIAELEAELQRAKTQRKRAPKGTSRQQVVAAMVLKADNPEWSDAKIKGELKCNQAVLSKTGALLGI